MNTSFATYMKFYPVSYKVVGFVDIDIFIGICHVLFDLRWEVIVVLLILVIAYMLTITVLTLLS